MSTRDRDLARIESTLDACQQVGRRVLGPLADLLQAERELIAADLRRRAEWWRAAGSGDAHYELLNTAERVERAAYLPEAEHKERGDG